MYFFCKLTFERKTGTPGFKKQVQRKEKNRNSPIILKEFLKNYYFCPHSTYLYNICKTK